MQNLGIVTFNDNIDNLIKARQCISSNNIIVFVKEEYERDIQRCNKGTDIHIKFLREMEDYRGKLDMLMFISAPADFIYKNMSLAPKIAVTNNVLLQLGGYKIESTMPIGNHLFLVIEPLPIKKETVEIKIVPEVIKIEVPIVAPVVETIETKQEIETVEPIAEVVEQAAETIVPVVEEKKEEEVIEPQATVAIESEPEPIVEPIIEVKEEVIEIKKEQPRDEKRFAKSKRGKK